MIAATTRAFKRALGLPDGLIHIGKGKLDPLGVALADDVGRRLREFSDDDPGGELCTGCVMMALVAAAAELGPRVVPDKFSAHRREASAAFLAAMSDAMADASEAIRRGRTWTQRDH